MATYEEEEAAKRRCIATWAQILAKLLPAGARTETIAVQLTSTEVAEIVTCMATVYAVCELGCVTPEADALMTATIAAWISPPKLAS